MVSFQTRRQLDYPAKNMEPENDGFSGVNDAAAMETISYQMFNPLDFFPPFSNHRLNPFSHPALVAPKRVIFNEKTGKIHSV